MAVKNNVNPVHIDIINAEPCENTADPIDQKQEEGKPFSLILVLHHLTDADPKTRKNKRHGAMIHGAEAVNGIPDKVRLLKKNHTNQRIQIGRKLT